MASRHATPTFTHAQAIEAIRARIAGVFDNEQLMKLGALSISTEGMDDIWRILDATAEVPAHKDDDPTLAQPTGPELPPGTIGKALLVTKALANAGVLAGFDSDDEVDGCDAVDVLAKLWPVIREVVPRSGS